MKEQKKATKTMDDPVWENKMKTITRKCPLLVIKKNTRITTKMLRNQGIHI